MVDPGPVMRPRTSPPTAYGVGARRRTSAADSPASATPRATPATSAGVHRLPVMRARAAGESALGLSYLILSMQIRPMTC